VNVDLDFFKKVFCGDFVIVGFNMGYGYDYDYVFMLLKGVGVGVVFCESFGWMGGEIV